MKELILSQHWVAAALVVVLLAGGGCNTQDGSHMDSSIIVVGSVVQIVQETLRWCGDDYGPYGCTSV